MQLNPVDYIIIAILLGSLYAGYRQGLIGAVGSIIAFVAGLALAVFFYHNLAAWLDHYFNVSNTLADWLRAKFPLAALAPQASMLKLPQVDTIYKDTAGFLAGNLLLIISFLLIMVVGTQVIRLATNGISSLLDGTIFAGVNRGLGAAVVLVKNLVIMAVIIGLILPSLQLGSSMGLPQAGAFNGYVTHSFMADWLLQWFNLVKGMIT